jgi:DNA-binding CsgD family transcriptional regulator
MHLNTRDIELVNTIFDIDSADGYPATAAAAASELLGSPTHRLVLRDGRELGNGVLEGASLPIAVNGEDLGTLHLAAAPRDAELGRAVAGLLARGLLFSRRLAPRRDASQALAESPLTPRERDVVTRLVAGASTRDISSAMGLTISTVNTYMKRIFAKLGVHSRVELVAWVNGTKS